MNVYASAIAHELAACGVAVDVWTATRRPRPTLRRHGQLLRTIALPRGWIEPPVGASGRCGAAATVDHEQVERWLGDFGITTERYDGVHAHYWRSVPLATAISQRHDAPLFYTFHTIGRVRERFRTPAEPPQPPARIAYESRAVREAAAVIVSCASERRELAAIYGADLPCVATIAPGVDRHRFHHTDRRRPQRSDALLLAVARIDPVKGLDLAIEACAAVARQTRRSTTMAIAGGPSGHGGAGELLRLRRVARAVRGPRCRVAFIGPQDHAAVARLYQRADVTLVSSYSESYGLVTLESLASGTPVVGTAVGVVPEVIRDQLNGHVARSRAVHEFAEAISGVLVDANPARLRAAAIEAAHGYSWHAAAQRLIELYGFPRPARRLRPGGRCARPWRRPEEAGRSLINGNQAASERS